MLQHEFETLYGKKVGKNEFEIINALYMLNDNETKQEFVTRYKKMSKEDLISEFVVLKQRRKDYEDGQDDRIEKLEEALYSVAIDAQMGHCDTIKQKVREVLGAFNVISYLWKNSSAQLGDDDIDVLMHIAEEGGAR